MMQRTPSPFVFISFETYLATSSDKTMGRVQKMMRKMVGMSIRPLTIIQIFKLFEYLFATRHSNIAFYSIQIAVQLFEYSNGEKEIATIH